MKLLAFAASSSRKSINGQLVRYAASLVENANTEFLDLNDYEMPIFSVDREQELGILEPAQRFFNKIGAADALLISFAEHNGSYAAAYKNLYDWTSRINAKVFQEKPIIMLSTSPGGRGGAGVLATAETSAGHFGGIVKASLCIPDFYKNFDVDEQRISNPELQTSLENVLGKLFT